MFIKSERIHCHSLAAFTYGQAAPLYTQSLCICSPEEAGYRAVLTLLSCTQPKAVSVFWPLLMCKRFFLNARLQALHCLYSCHVPGPGCDCLTAITAVQACPLACLAAGAQLLALLSCTRPRLCLSPCTSEPGSPCETACKPYSDLTCNPILLVTKVLERICCPDILRMTPPRLWAEFGHAQDSQPGNESVMTLFLHAHL